MLQRTYQRSCLIVASAFKGSYQAVAQVPANVASFPLAVKNSAPKSSKEIASACGLFFMSYIPLCIYDRGFALWTLEIVKTPGRRLFRLLKNPIQEVIPALTDLMKLTVVAVIALAVGILLGTVTKATLGFIAGAYQGYYQETESSPITKT